MDDVDIEQMATLEREHWWYRGLRHMIESLLSTPRFALPHGCRVLDAGCGTGENLRLLQRLLRPSYCGGFDISAHAATLCREKLGAGADIYVGDIRSPAVHVDQLDIILSCDVLGIAGLEASKSGLQCLAARLKRGGLFVLNVAALGWLLSSHDVVMGQRNRFSACQIQELMAEIGLQAELVTYRVFWLFPAIVLRRLPSMMFRPKRERARSDLAGPPALANRVLLGSLRAESWMVMHGIRFPWGSSLFAVGRKDRGT